MNAVPLPLISLAAHPVGPGHPCLVIGEVAQAHDGSLGAAHAFVNTAAADRLALPLMQRNAGATRAFVVAAASNCAPSPPVQRNVGAGFRLRSRAQHKCRQPLPGNAR